MDTADADERANLVPLIDCMFFLIMFFMIVTKFTPDELQIASLLPSQQGQIDDDRRSPPLLPEPQATIAILPIGMPREAQPSHYEALVTAQERDHRFGQRVEMRVGGSAGIEIDATALALGAGDAACEREMGRVHAYLAAELGAREIAGEARADQADVRIACCSRLSWSLAMLALDGVRAYERDRASAPTDAMTLADAREVTFTAPPIRNSTRYALGDEIHTLVHLR
ncbi:MAG TPA: biopolymer transporter ExbD [Planctomycetota bacterium]|nr:biopolymer transporter ExbD [Planctomycetota bacterium]